MAYRTQDSWSSDYDYLIDLGHQIQTKIKENDQRGGASQREISQLIREYERGIQSLRQHMKQRSFSEREHGRRQKKIDELSERLMEFKRSQVLNMNPFDDDMESHSHSGRTGPGLGQRLTVDDIKVQQQQIIAEQDRGLDAISDALRRQQRIGFAIQDEVVEHNVLIDDISRGTTRVDARVQRETERIEHTRRKEKTWCTCVLWTMVIILAIAIIVVGVVPKPK